MAWPGSLDEERNTVHWHRGKASEASGTRHGYKRTEKDTFKFPPTRELQEDSRVARVPMAV